MADDDDDGSFGGAYEDGHWIWDDGSGRLIFMSDLPEPEMEVVPIAVKLPTTFQFKELDLIDQMRFRKRFQRKVKAGVPDVITVQDIKDLTLYTAPLALLTPTLIDFLHLPTTERFLRALILYCQYYLQIKEEMSRRMLEAQTKVRSHACEQIESKYRENLCDLRSVVAKEYCTILIGGDDTKKFHHMGPLKKRSSLSTKDARDFEILLHVCIQIVWLALGRRSLNYLELEVNRIFKSDIFNTVEHKLKTGYPRNLTPEEQRVLLGDSLQQYSKPSARSPLADEVFRNRQIDFRAMGIGVIKYDNLCPRLQYMLIAITAPEEQLIPEGVTVGILGYPRSFFDTTLHVLPTVMDDGAAKSSKSNAGSSSNKSVNAQKSTKSGFMKKDKSAEMKWVYCDIILPEKDPNEPPYPPSFPDENAPIRPCNEFKRVVWRNRLFRLLHPQSRRKSTFIAPSENGSMRKRGA